MEVINREAKTMQRWEELLLPGEYEALKDRMYDPEPEEPFTPDEVLDAIVEYNGGIATGYHIRSLIGRIYGVEL